MSGAVSSASPLIARAEPCAFCSAPGVSYFRHAFPFTMFSAPLLLRPFCALHYPIATAIMMTSPAEFLPQLPPESASQRTQREKQTAEYAAFVGSASSEGGRWLADERNTEPKDSSCRVCRLIDPPAEGPVQHSRSQLHRLCGAMQLLPLDQVGLAVVLPASARCPADDGHGFDPESPCFHQTIFDEWCEAHVWDAVRLMEFWDPTADGGKGNVRSFYADNMTRP